MPRRNWRPPSDEVLARHKETYSCPKDCAAHSRMMTLYGVLTYELVDESRTSGKRVPIDKQMVNGWQMRALIADFLLAVGEAISTGALKNSALLQSEYSKNPTEFIVSPSNIFNFLQILRVLMGGVNIRNQSSF